MNYESMVRSKFGVTVEATTAFGIPLLPLGRCDLEDLGDAVDLTWTHGIGHFMSFKGLSSSSTTSPTSAQPPTTAKWSSVQVGLSHIDGRGHNMI